MGLHLGSGEQALNYFFLSFFSVLGVIQLTAARANRRDLMWFEARVSLLLGALTIPVSFVWFFVADKEIFIPGLAGGEIIAIFLAAFLAAVPLTRAIAFAINRAHIAEATPRVTRAKETTL